MADPRNALCTYHAFNREFLHHLHLWFEIDPGTNRASEMPHWNNTCNTLGNVFNNHLKMMFKVSKSLHGQCAQDGLFISILYNFVHFYSVQWQGFLLIYWPWFSLHKMVYLSILYSVQWQEKRTTIKLSNQGLYIPKTVTNLFGVQRWGTKKSTFVGLL